MYNPSVPYRGPDGATLSLTQELTKKFGAPSRPYEFVTGWKSPTNISGHNPDSAGITHGVDIFTGDLRWTADHLAARGKAGDRRVLYVIYAGQIASPSTGWVFAGSGWEHWDHVHLSVWDGHWGSPCTLPASITSDTSSWGITNPPLKPQGDIKPIPQEDFDMTAADKVIDYVRAMMWGGFTSGGKDYPGIGKVTIENQRRINTLAGKVDAQTELVKQLAKGQGVTIDYAKVEAAAAAGVAKAMADGVDLDATVTIKGADNG